MIAQDLRLPIENDCNKKDLKEVIPYIPEIIDEKYIDNNGKTITQQFMRGKLLGKGGFGRCYVGTVVSSKAIYALKIVPKSNLVKSKAKQKLQSEIKIHRDLRNQHIVRFDRHFEDIHNVYIVLELCSNNSMSEMLKRRKKLLEVEVRYYIHQLVSSLQYLHRLLIIHRDLKLGNLFIDNNMKIKVGDFGLAAKLITSDERRKTVCGTPNYLAPEILSGKEGHSFPVDIWSTGVVMYTLLIGKPPFESTDMKSTYKRILGNAYSFPDHTIISENAKSLIRFMLQHREEKRPSLNEILSHSFFTSPSAYIPTTLPESAVREVPIILPPEKIINTNNNYTSNYLNDENDPNKVNILNNKMNSNEYEVKHAPITKRISSISNDRSKSNIPGVHKVINEDTTETRRPSTGRSIYSSNNTTNVVKNNKPTNLLTNLTSGRMTTRLQTQNNKKFDVFADNKPSSNISTNPLVNLPSNKIKSNDDRSGVYRRNSTKYQTIESLQDDLDKLQVIDKNSHKIESKQAWMNDSEKRIDIPVDKPIDKCKQLDRSVDNNLCTPPDQLINPVTEEQKGTLEVMHDMLDHSYITTNNVRKINLDNSFNLNNEIEQPISYSTNQPSSQLTSPLNQLANVWVVRYVDYTSKYGLGFLLNNGCTGVYFNDSTKIILSSDGLIFQYIERSRNISKESKNDYSIQSHMLTSYPIQLQKKVTLLKHFRNYLIDQFKSQSNTERDNEIVNSIPMIIDPSHSSSGGNPNIAFGVSSVADSMIDMPFVKKWVRTRHAILFRLSNRIVQVIFFDKSEILLTSEAHIVTYVNKQGMRSEYSIEDVMQANRLDIAKRLRYTKDIMYRLINIQAR